MWRSMQQIMWRKSQSLEVPAPSVLHLSMYALSWMGSWGHQRLSLQAKTLGWWKAAKLEQLKVFLAHAKARSQRLIPEEVHPASVHPSCQERSQSQSISSCRSTCPKCINGLNLDRCQLKMCRRLFQRQTSMETCFRVMLCDDKFFEGATPQCHRTALEAII